MADPRVYIASLASVVVINGQGIAVPLGFVQNFTTTKNYDIERVREWGNYEDAELVFHGYGATFGWQEAWSEGVDLVLQGILPSDAAIATFQPIYIRIMDKLGQRNLAFLKKGYLEACTVGADAKTMLRRNVTGQCISVQYESELN